MVVAFNKHQEPFFPWMLHRHSHLNRKTVFQGIVLFTADVGLVLQS